MKREFECPVVGHNTKLVKNSTPPEKHNPPVVKITFHKDLTFTFKFVYIYLSEAKNFEYFSPR